MEDARGRPAAAKLHWRCSSLTPRWCLSDKPGSEELTHSSPVTPDRAAATRLLARSFYRELRSSGYTASQLIALSTVLIELITLDLLRGPQRVTRAGRTA